MTNNQILLYQSEDGETRVEVLHQDQTLWFSQRDMAEVFQRDVKTINRHVQNVYADGELETEGTISYFEIVQMEGKRTVKRDVAHYNLDMIISVGYRVNSIRGTQFRIWATKQLREFIIKGFVLNDERLAGGGSPYFEELLRRVRAIRASEANFYRQVRDIFSLSYDYDDDLEKTHLFFATVQNKLHYAIHGHTAAELIAERADSKKRNMGLTNWRKVNITLADARVAKNYMDEDELKGLELLVEQFLSFAEFQIHRKRLMYMSDWILKLDQFIGELNDLDVLDNAGKVSSAKMRALIRERYKAYKQRRIAETTDDEQ